MMTHLDYIGLFAGFITVYMYVTVLPQKWRADRVASIAEKRKNAEKANRQGVVAFTLLLLLGVGISLVVIFGDETTSRFLHIAINYVWLLLVLIWLVFHLTEKFRSRV